MTSIPNIFAVSSNTSMTLSSLLNNSVESTYSFDAFNTYNSLTKQYHSASNALLNFKTPYFDTNTGKYIENTNSSSQSEFSPVLGARNVSSSNYSFGPSNMLQTGFAPPNNIIGTKSSLSQFSSGYLQSTASNYPTLGSNTGTSAFNVPCFNTKFGASDGLNNNYLYPPNLFNTSTKLPPYNASQGSTQIFPPPPFGNNGIFPPGPLNSSLMSHTVQDAGGTNGSSYHQSAMLYAGASSIPQVPSSESLSAPGSLGTPSKNILLSFLW